MGCWLSEHAGVRLAPDEVPWRSPHGGRRQRRPAQLVDSHRFKLLLNRGRANLRSVSPAERCQWSRHLVSRLLRGLGSMPRGGVGCHRHCEPQGRPRNPFTATTHPCHLVVACDKVLCGRLQTACRASPDLHLDNDGPLDRNRPCPARCSAGPGGLRRLRVELAVAGRPLLAPALQDRRRASLP